MKNKTLVAVIILILFIFAGVNISYTTRAQHIETKKQDTTDQQIIIVDKTGSADYTNIQDAIDNSQENQVILVKKGYYPEIINIRKTIKLLGEEKTNTIINPISEKNRYAIRLGAPNIILERLSITNGAPGLYTNAIRVASSNNKINECNVYDTPIGIAMWTPNNRIENCSFQNCKDEGISLLGSEFSKCENNIIKNCVFKNNCDGIELQYSSRNRIINCELYNNSHSGIDAISKSNNENLISNCKIYNNNVHGIYFASSSNNTIQKCHIYDNKDANIYMNTNSKNNLIKENNVFQEPEDTSNINIEEFFKIKIRLHYLSIFSIIF